MKPLFAVFDKVAGVFGPPFVAVTPGVASRMVADELRRPDSMYAQHAEDFALYHVGSFEEQTGVVESRRGETVDDDLPPEKLVELATLAPDKVQGREFP